MLVAIIAEKNIENSLAMVEKNQDQADAFELRLDFLSDLDVERLKEFRSHIHKPMILTVRSENQGGQFRGCEEDRLACLMVLCQLKPEYIDLEYDVDDAFISACHQRFPDTKIIRSYHHFTETPHDLEQILSDMKHPDVSIYKVVTFANSTLDTIRMCHFLKKHQNLVAHCMGELGMPSRVLGPVFGNVFVYASTDQGESPAPGCLDIKTLLETYRIDTLNQDSQIFALLGDPVAHSVGHLFHNQQFHERKINAVYVKCQLTEADLPAFFEGIQGLPFKGFSVTMPLKEAVIPFMHSLEKDCQQIGACNTIHVRQNKCYGSNTDGAGALDAIEKSVRVSESTILIIGAGGAAKAIAYEAAKRQAKSIIILNRTGSKAQTLASRVGGEAFDFESFNEAPNVDVVFNTLPSTEEADALVMKHLMPRINTQTTYMDINYATQTSQMKNKLQQQGCRLIDGYGMYVNQALRQLETWL